MLFKGRLRLPGDAGEGIPIDMTLEDVYLSLDSGGEEFGEWRLDVVEINRLFSNQFSLMLDGEEMVFVANDALGFAYDGLSFVEEVQSRLKKRRVFKGRKAKRAKAKKSRPEPEPERATPAAAPVADVPMPEVKPFFPEPAASEEPAGVPDGQPVAETPSAPPTVPPVSPASPTRRNVHPLGDPDEEVVEPYLEKSVEPVAPSAAAPADPPAAQPPAAQPPAVQPPAAQTPAAAASPPPDAVEAEDDDELVIEDVNPYGYQAPVSMIPKQQARPAPEPTKEVASSPEPVPPAVVEPEPEAEPAPSQPAVEPVPEAAPEPTPEPASWPFAARVSEPEVEAEAEVEVEVEAETDARAAEPQTRIPQSSGRHTQDESKSRSSFFGRRKSKEPEPHDHVYESSKTVGGITRSVCSVCGHVSFSGEDVYQNW